MKWLTRTEIERRANKSYKEALLVSIEHHQQIANATRKEFFTAIGEKKVSISSDHCGLCQRTNEGCKDCLLRASIGYNGCGSDWQALDLAIHSLIMGRHDGRLATWSAVVEAEKNMIKVLKKELKKQKGA